MEFHQMHVSPNMSQQLFHNIFSYCRIFLKLQRKSNQNEYTQSTKLFNIIKALSLIVIKRENNSSQPVDAVSYYAFLLILAPTLNTLAKKLLNSKAHYNFTTLETSFLA